MPVGYQKFVLRTRSEREVVGNSGRLLTVYLGITSLEEPEREAPRKSFYYPTLKFNFY